MRETIGQLLQAYGEALEPSNGRRSIHVLRRDRLSDAFERAGVSIARREASVLADGLATGHLAVTDSDVYLINTGGAGIRASCDCRGGGSGCVLIVRGGTASCTRTSDSTCQRCGFIVGVNVPVVAAVALAGNAGALGEKFTDPLPEALSEAADDLGELSYPLADRLSLSEQMRERGREPSRALSHMSYPVMSLADGLEKVFATPRGNLMQWAVGDYAPRMTRNLARAFAVGAIQVDPASREVKVVTRARAPGVVVDVDCSCSRGGAGCFITISPTGGNIACEPAACRGACLIVVTIPSDRLPGFGTQFSLD
jgi:hypothetical protein